MKIAIAGAGAWGTALGLILSRNGHSVVLWGHDPGHLREVRNAHVNERHLPGVPLPPDWEYSESLPQAVAAAEVLLVAVPSKFFRSIVAQVPFFRGITLSVTKGIEFESGKTMSSILREVIPHASAAVLSGPTLADEVARDYPSAIVAASADASSAMVVQELFHRPSFRVYRSADVAGVELGGALKNVIAIGAGVGDGLGFGDNSKAALITRAIVEIRRLGVACGAQPETFSGLSGLGDLTVTCFSKLSRNRKFGDRLGKGENIEQILLSSHSVAEGYPTARSAWELARKLKVETPIIDEVYAMLYEGKDLTASLHDLMHRSSKAEDE